MRVIKLIILVGDSGSGKNHSLRILESNGFKKIVTDTTREPREGEVDGVDYNFVSKEVFKAKAKIEANNIKGTLYGLMVNEFLEAIKENDNLAVILEPSGMLSLLDYLDNTDIFPNINELFDVNIIYLDVPEEIRFHRLVDDYISKDKEFDCIYTAYLEKMSGKELMHSINVAGYKYFKQAIDRMNRIPKDENGLSIFDTTFNSSHLEYMELDYHLDNLYCNLHIYRHIDKISIDTFLSENNII